MCFSTELTPYTEKGRERIYKRIRPDIQREIGLLMKSTIPGTDEFQNLRILHKEVHKLIHHTNKEMIDVLIHGFGMTNSMIKKINKYREKCGLQLIK